MKRLVPAFLIKWGKAIHDKLIPGDSKVGVSGDLEVSGGVTADSFLGDNAKPLYYHFVVMVETSTPGYQLSVIIINNDPAPLADYAALKAYIKAQAEALETTARFICNGCYGPSKMITNVIDVTTAGSMTLFGIDAETMGITNATITNLTPYLFVDTVTKLN